MVMDYMILSLISAYLPEAIVQSCSQTERCVLASGYPALLLHLYNTMDYRERVIIKTLHCDTPLHNHHNIGGHDVIIDQSVALGTMS